MNGDTVVPGFKLQYGDCNASIIGSSEGAQWKTNLNEASVMWYWRKALCRQVPLYFEKTVPKGIFTGYKYVLLENVYDRSNDSETDCYKGPAQTLPDGLSDLSKCYYGKINLFGSEHHAIDLKYKKSLFINRYAIRSIESPFLWTLSE